MYNRYIPQPDGSYRRSRMPDRIRPIAPQPCKQEPICPEPKPEPPKPEPITPPPCPPPRKNHPHHRSRPQPHPEPPHQDTSVSGFLRRLIPKDFDTGDLLIVLLLLLMAGDCAEDQNTALLTLALYFFM